MVFFNYATMQMAVKIVYYGPGLCGMTTNLHHIYAETSPQSRGEMVSLETETDRTLFFDLLPIDVGVIGGFKTRLQLYTVPGQVFYNTTRKLVLKGVDGIVFVADSQRAMLDANVESLKNLRENLAEIGTNLDEIPLVLQLNKRDLPNIAPVEVMLDALDPERKAESVESVAAAGTGVFETLKLVSKLTLRTLRRRMTGEEPARPAPARSGQFRVQDNGRTPSGSMPALTLPTTAPASTPPAAAPAAPAAAPIAPPAPAPAPATSAATAQKYNTDSLRLAERAESNRTLVQELPAAALPTAPTAYDGDATIAAPSIDRRFIADAPVPEAPYIAPPPAARVAPPAAPPAVAPPVIAPPGPTPPIPPAPVAPPIAVRPAATAPFESSGQAPAEAAALFLPIDEAPFEAPFESNAPLSRETIAEPAPFAYSAPRVAEPEPAPEDKTVKVRNSVDVMAELEALRKRATNTTAKIPKRDVMADLDSLRPKRDLNRTLNIQLPTGILARSKTVRVTLEFEDGQAAVIDTQNQNIELGDASDVQSLSVNVKIDLA